MARVGFYLFTEQKPGGPDGGSDSDPQTLLQIAAGTDHRITILGADISLQGDTPASTPIEFSWIIQTDQGTQSATITAQKADRGYDEAIVGTFSTYNSGTPAEPTAGATLIEFALHRQGFMQWRPPFPIIVKGGERVGFQYHGVDADTANNINTILTVYCQQ